MAWVQATTWVMALAVGILAVWALATLYILGCLVAIAAGRIGQISNARLSARRRRRW